MRVCRKIEDGVTGLEYVAPPAEVTVSGQGYGGIFSNTASDGRSIVELMAEKNAPADSVAESSSTA